MVSKIMIGVIVVIVLIVGFFMFGFTSPDDEAIRAGIRDGNLEGVSDNSLGEFEREQIIIGESTFEFEGFGPGKSHIGKFDDWSGEFFIIDDEIVGFEGEIMASSVNTGIGGLDTHLQSDDFFDVERYPEIYFKSKEIMGSNLVGDLTFRGVTKEISFPTTIGMRSMAADFVLDTTPFNFKYIGVDKEVRIAFDLRR